MVSVNTSSDIWGVNQSGNICHWNGSSWSGVSGGLKWVSVGNDGSVWGVNNNDDIYTYLGNNNWQQINGGLAQVSVGDKNHVVGVNKSGDAFRWKGNKWAQFDFGFKVKHISVNSHGLCWVLNNEGHIFEFSY